MLEAHDINPNLDHFPPTGEVTPQRFKPSLENCSPCYYLQKMDEKPFCRKVFQMNPEECPFTGPMVESSSFLVPLSAVNTVLGRRYNPWRRSP